MPTPKTIKIFLVDGDPTGTKVVELSNWSGIAYLIPRNSLKKALTNRENSSDLNSQCVYFLIGDEDDKRHVYVGEAEEFSKRINQHNKNKDFWNLVLVFSSKDDNLTKAHVKYLESKITSEIKNSKRVDLENGNTPPEPKLPRSDLAEMKEFYENMKFVASSLGYTFLEGAPEKTDKLLLFCEGPGAKGLGFYTDEGFILVPDSKFRGKSTPSIGVSLELKRKQIMTEENGRFDEEGNFILMRQLIFSSPSMAAGICLGRRANGWTEWKTVHGKTLDELKRK